MDKKTRVGFIGVGLMGHGAAKNIMERGGYPLTILGHRNREPVEDLIRRGAREASDPAGLQEIHRMAVARRLKWVTPMARASAASGGGVSVSPSMARIMKAT